MNPAEIRAVASDLDGTLLRRDMSVSAFTRSELHRVVATGRMLAFVTGRPPRWMPPIIAATGHDGIAVCANGAVVLDVRSEQIVAHHVLPPAALGEVCAVIRTEMGSDARFGVELAPVGPMTGSRLVHESGFSALLPAPQDVLPLGELVTSADAVKLLARGTGPVSQTEEIAARVRAATGDVVTVSHSSRTTQLLEIAPAGITKASTLAEVVAVAGFGAADVVAFGDMPNDIPMLQWAGWGIAVADAHAAVIAAAQEVVPDADHDGPAGWLAAHLQ